MHASVVMPILISDEVSTEGKQRIADLVVRQGKMIGGNFSEPGHTSLMRASAECPGAASERRISHQRPEDVCFHDRGGRLRSRSGISRTATAPTAGMLALIPPDAEGRQCSQLGHDWNARDPTAISLILKDCWVPDNSIIYRSDDIRPFRNTGASWFWGSYTAVYLGWRRRL